MRQTLLSALVALLCGFAGAAIWSYSGLGNTQTRDYLVAHPDILPQMAEAYQRQEAERKLASVADDVTRAFPGAVLGNPQGSTVLVKFTDYGCGFCRASLPDVEKLIANNPDLKVVVREWPIFEGSEQAARMALAAAKQGRFEQFYTAMFDADAPTPANVEMAARKAGLDLDAARSFAASNEATRELAGNMAMAQSLGFGGTPSWVVGEQVLEGAVGYEELSAAVTQAAEAS